MAVFFISDLHLSDARPDINRVFFEFLRGPARQAESLYVLGDLFEYWAGDDDLGDPFNRSVAAALSDYSRAGIPLKFMHGNRDFLLDGEFAKACGGTLLDDPHALELFGTPTVLMHGDTLCTDDVEYQKFRVQVRNPAWQKGFLALPLEARKRQIQAVRQTSESEKTRKAPEIMDVNQGAVETALRNHGYPRLIHGHTHRPARHVHRVDGRTCERWVLADWYRSGSYLRCEAGGCEPVPLAP